MIFLNSFNGFRFISIQRTIWVFVGVWMACDAEVLSNCSTCKVEAPSPCIRDDVYSNELHPERYRQYTRERGGGWR